MNILITLDKSALLWYYTIWKNKSIGRNTLFVLSERSFMLRLAEYLEKNARETQGMTQ